MRRRERRAAERAEDRRAYGAKDATRFVLMMAAV